MPKPSILFINRVYMPDRGASGRMLRDLAQGFASQGWDVSVLTTGRRSGQEKDGEVTLHRVKAKIGRKTMFAYFNAWTRLLIKGMRLPRHDLVVTMTDPPMLVVAGAMIASRKKSQHLHWCQDLYPELLPVLGYDLPEWANEFLTKLSRRAMKKCERVIVVGRCMARALIHRGLDARTISVIPNWPDRELADGYEAAAETPTMHPMMQSPPGKAPQNLFRDANDMKFRVLYAGTLGRAHPVETVLGAAQILQKTHRDIEFVFVGNGPQFERLAAERVRRGLDNIKLLPWQPNSSLRALMQSGDVHLVTMRHDAAGLLVPCKLYSALAAGRPCILVGPEHSEAGKVLLDFNAGTVVPQGDAQLLAATIQRFREDGEVWFAAQYGSSQAGSLFLAAESIRAWVERAQSVLGPAPKMPVKASVAIAQAKAAADTRSDRAA
jgi:glycosyltransferase involved in cell wall biosynthesis